MTVEAVEFTFGIEIETTMPLGRVQRGPHGYGTPVTGMPTGWVAMGDGSIHASRGREGVEFVSPVLRGAAGLKSVVDAVKWIKDNGGKVNESCGFHVHVGFDRENKTALERLVNLVANFEKAIYAATGTKKRERSAWCRNISAFGEAGRVQTNAQHDRYRVLNLTNLMNGRKPTVEFRAFSGTLNINKIVGYIRLCVGLVHRAVDGKRKATWVGKTPAPTSPQHRKGEGMTAITRLFYQLGWTKGRMSVPYGLIAAADAPSLEDTKSTIRGMARRYDADTGERRRPRSRSRGAYQDAVVAAASRITGMPPAIREPNTDTEWAAFHRAANIAANG